jgi:hypothetical protein
MNITLSADEKVITAARNWATAHGTSVNALIRGFLASLENSGDAGSAAEQFAKNARESAGHSAPETDLSRRGIYRGRRFGTPE